MNSWTVRLDKPAQKEFRNLEEGPKRDVSELMQDLAEDPSLVPAIELRHNPDVWRARFHHDRFRIVYQISRQQKLILVKRIRPRPTAYDRMKH